MPPMPEVSYELGTIEVIVAWAVPQHAVLRPLRVAPGTTIEGAIVASGLLQDVPEIDLAVYPVGIYGKKKPLDTVPKESRRRRAAHKSAAAG
jgi:putative ubiquitin-RnfH superfamily antitoxin RatB of RatAB toxin-antitoxin module